MKSKIIRPTRFYQNLSRFFFHLLGDGEIPQTMLALRKGRFSKQIVTLSFTSIIQPSQWIGSIRINDNEKKRITRQRKTCAWNSLKSFQLPQHWLYSVPYFSRQKKQRASTLSRQYRRRIENEETKRQQVHSSLVCAIDEGTYIDNSIGEANAINA